MYQICNFPLVISFFYLCNLFIIKTIAGKIFGYQLISWTLKTNWLPLPSMSGTSLVSDSNKSTISPYILSSILNHVFQQNLYCPSYQIFITHRTPSFILHCISLSHHNKQNLFYLPEFWLFYLPEFWLFYLTEFWQYYLPEFDYFIYLSFDYFIYLSVDSRYPDQF